MKNRIRIVRQKKLAAATIYWALSNGIPNAAAVREVDRAVRGGSKFVSSNQVVSYLLNEFHPNVYVGPTGMNYVRLLGNAPPEHPELCAELLMALLLTDPSVSEYAAEVRGELAVLNHVRLAALHITPWRAAAPAA